MSVIPLYQDKLFDQISMEETLEILQRMIQFQTVNPPGDTTECAEYLVSLLKNEDIEARVIEPEPGKGNAVAKLVGDKPGKTLHFNGHIDVAPPGEDWPVNPFGGVLKDGEIWGRGACDMKSGITAMIVALFAIKRASIPFAGEIIFAAVTDEETGSKKGSQFLLEQGIVAADMAICSEPTDMAVELGNRGQMSVTITVSGISSHAGRPHLGVNAIHFAAEIIQALEQIPMKDLRNELFEVPTASLSVTKIQGGLADDMIPDRCILTVDRRVLPSESFESAANEIQQAIESLEKPERVGVSYEVYGNFPPCLTPVRSPVVQAIINSYKTTLNTAPLIRGKSAATDASHLVAAGIPTVIFGPGNSAFSHTANERVSLERVLMTAKIYGMAAMDLLRE